MKVIFVAPKSNIPSHLLDKLSNHAEISFYEDNPVDIREIKALKEPGEKILCPFPEPMAWVFPNDLIPEIKDLKGIRLRLSRESSRAIRLNPYGAKSDPREKPTYEAVALAHRSNRFIDLPIN